jgi:hypothetical protein
MTTPELLKDLLVTIQCLKKELAGSDAEKVKVAQEAYQELLDGFYEEYQEMMAPQQYEAAKKDFDYFMRLVDLATAFYREEEVERGTDIH